VLQLPIKSDIRIDKTHFKQISAVSHTKKVESSMETYLEIDVDIHEVG